MKRKMNKRIALILAGFLLISVTGCGNSGVKESNENETMEIAGSEDEGMEVLETEDETTEPVAEGEADTTGDEDKETISDGTESDSQEETTVTTDTDSKKDTSDSKKETSNSKKDTSDSKKETSGSTGDKKKPSDGGNKQESSDGKKPDNGKDEKPDTPTIIAPSVKSGTMGETLWNSFQNAVTKEPGISMEDLANVLVTDPVIQFMGASMPVEVGAEYFMGFGEYQITGYDSAAVFMPMIGSIAFVGYVFDVSDDVKVSKFVKNLKNNCDPRWNICVEAEQTVVGAVDDKVFFVMCPEGIE